VKWDEEGYMIATRW